MKRLFLLLIIVGCACVANAINFYSQKIANCYAGAYHTLTIDESGNLWAWGYNYCGQLGDGTTQEKYIPVQIMSATKFKIAVAGFDFSMAIDESGNLWGWGTNNSGQLGNETVANSTSTPVPIKFGTKFKTVSIYYSHTLAIDESGNLWSWGSNTKGQLGDGTTSDKSSPVKIKSGTKFKYISAGTAHSMAIDESGNLWTWGNNKYGQLGDGTISDKSTPVTIKSGTKFQNVSTGFAHSMAIDETKKLWSWGGNSSGQLGDDSDINKSSPEQFNRAINSGIYLRDLLPVWPLMNGVIYGPGEIMVMES